MPATSTPIPSTSLAVLLFTDIVGSVDLKTRIGTSVYAPLLSRHDEIFRRIVGQTPGGEILKDLGDGFLTRFTSTSDAINVALRFQYALARENWEPEPIRVRVGVHVGQITELEEDIDGKQKIVGLAADLSARIMGLALPGQTLMTRAAFDDARQYVREHPVVEIEGEQPELHWMAHGPYLFQGAEEPLDVFEVGARGTAPLREPPDSTKAKRSVPAGEEDMYGWRPAIGLPIPGMAGWILERKLGAGGFGEVWLARHKKTSSLRVFKFCFDADRLRSFKRELTLFRLLHEALGERPDIARIHDIQLEKPPFFLEGEFTDHGDLLAWSDKRGGIGEVPLETRLDLVTRTAEAVAAAHSIGVLHKDIKPSNILIYEAADGEPRPRLADFGIGALTDSARLEDHSITATGFTETLFTEGDTSRTGTRMYSPPEALQGKASTVQGDVYALGVFLYQMVIGDLRRPLAQGWDSEVADPLLREDIAQCVAGKLEDRLGSAGELSSSLRDLALRRKAAKRRKLAKVSAAASVVLAVLLAVAAGLVVRERVQNRRITAQKDKAQEVARFMREMLAGIDPAVARGRQTLLLREILDDTAGRIETELTEQPEVEAAIRHTIGSTYSAIGEWTKARPQLERALELREQHLGERDPETLDTLNELGILVCDLERFEEAEELLSRAVELRRAELGETHPDTLTSMTELGILFTLAGRYSEAEEHALAAFEGRRAKLGAGHPDSLEAVCNLAQLRFEQGSYDAAEPILREAFDLAEENPELGASHPVTLMVMNEFGELLRGKARYDESEEVFAEALERCRTVFGEEHPRTLTALSNLGLLYRDAGRQDEAEPLLEKSYELHQEFFGKENEYTIVVMNNLALVYHERGRTEEAEALLAEGLALARGHVGDRHPTTLNMILNLANWRWRAQSYDESIPFYKEVCEGRLATLREGHPDALVVINNLATAYRFRERLEEARPVSIQALELHEEYAEADGLPLARARFNMAVVLENDGEYAAAEPLLVRAVETFRRIRGEGHSMTQKVSDRLAAVREELED